MGGLMDLKGRVALVTGAGQGVGRQVALYLAEHGAAGVVVNDYFQDRADVVAGEINEAGGKAIGVQADVTDLQSVTAMVATGEHAYGQIDILVNNAGNAGPTAGIGDHAPFWETGPEDWAKWMDVNYYGVLHSTRAVLPGMVERNYGRIVTVISDAGRVGEPHLVVYSGAKAGAAGLMRGVAKAVGRYGITVNSVALAAIETPTTAPMMAEEAARKTMLRSYVIRRTGQPEDPAGLILFLASDAASWITGQTYPVNGGYSSAL
ncbi:SDR family oxidoreductase [Nitriliruptoraceae bacterium ZYF776]|nr:SDR family oxidoreductase [Profundirhabdus halotolerans]